MSKKYFEKGRLKYFSRYQMIVLDYSTVAAICYAIAAFIFGSLTLIAISQWTQFFKAIPLKPKESAALVKKEGDLIEIDFMDTPKELLPLTQIPEKAQTPEKIAENIESKAPEMPPKVEPKIAPKPAPEIKPAPIVKKETPVPVPEKKVPEMAKSAPSGTTSVAPDNQSPITVNSTTETAETEEHIFYRKILESMIEEKLQAYKTTFPDKWKTVAGSYIVDVNITAKGEVQINLVTSSPNFYFNNVSEVIIKSIKYPHLKTYGLKTYQQTFIFTYRPYGNK